MFWQTGLDPEVRRLIWEIINRQRQGKTIVLTTHSMEEAEVLCQKIGIMAKGQLRCLGVRFCVEGPDGAKPHRRGLTALFSAVRLASTTDAAALEEQVRQRLQAHRGRQGRERRARPEVRRHARTPPLCRSPAVHRAPQPSTACRALPALATLRRC